jgi:hypothetical protein
MDDEQTQSKRYYDPILCSRCHTALKTFDELHRTHDQKSCMAKKSSKGAFVYLLLDTNQNLLKIGFSEEPARRYKEISNANTNKIECIGFIPGTRTNEANLHRKWRRHNKKLEWFEYLDEIVEYFSEHPEFNRI